MAHFHDPTSPVPSGSLMDASEDDLFKCYCLSNEFKTLDQLTMEIPTTIESGSSAWENDDFQAQTADINPQGGNSECPTAVATHAIDPQQVMIEDEVSHPETLRTIQENGPDSIDEALNYFSLSADTSQEPNTFGAGDDDLIGIHTAQPAEDPPGQMTSSPTKRKRRAPNWEDKEKDAYLKVKVEGLRCVKGKDWDFISETLATRYKIHRNPKSCEDLWGTLLKSYKRIRDHEIMSRNSEGRNSYFKMEEGERIAHKFPKSFPEEWCKMVERILKARGKLKCEESCSPVQDVPGYSGSAFPPEDGSTDPLSNLEPCLRSNLQINESTNSHIDRLNSNSTTMAEIKKVVMDAIQPIASLLQRREMEEEDYEAKLQTIAKKRRALDLEEMQLKRQRAGQHPRTRSKCRAK